MKLSMKYVILYVNDFEKTMHFYNDILGLPIKMRHETYVEFDTGNTILAINTREDVEAITGLEVPKSLFSTQTFEIGFVVDNVHEVIESLRTKNIPILKEPITKPWGQTVAYVADPDGHYIEICTSLE